MDVAIAQMSERNGLGARIIGLDTWRFFLNEARHGRDRNADIMLQRCARGTFSLGNRIANFPKSFCLHVAARDRRIFGQIMRDGILQQMHGQLSGAGLGRVVLHKFHQSMPAVRGVERRPCARNMREHGTKCPLGKDFKSLQTIAPMFLHEQQKFIGLLRGIDARPHDAAVNKRGHGLQHGLGHHANRAFAANQQLFQVIAAIVFFQWRHGVINRSIGQNSLKTRNEQSHCAVPQHLRAARVG